MRSDRERIQDILERCRLLREHVEPKLDRLAEDPILIGAAQYWILIIGEAAANVSPAFRESHPEVAWRGPIGMRQILAHGYFHADVDIVRDVVEHEIPPLEAKIVAILEELE